jgi:4-hydroxy-tetrahydrodipicolinate reductase
MSIKVSVVGASGRMGKLALELIEGAQDLELHSALDSKSQLSQSLGADVIFDVTKLSVSQEVVSFAISNGISTVVGTSGWSEAKLAELTPQLKNSAGTAVVVIPNFSIGSMLASDFSAQAAKYFESIEIIETHHAGKVDSPSGTAVRTAELIAEARKNLTQPLIPGVGQQARGEVVAGIPIHSLRQTGASANQEVRIHGDSELIRITHEVSSIRAYSYGILQSIRVAHKEQGLLVGLKSAIESNL